MLNQKFKDVDQVQLPSTSRIIINFNIHVYKHVLNRHDQKHFTRLNDFVVIFSINHEAVHLPSAGRGGRCLC